MAQTNLGFIIGMILCMVVFGGLLHTFQESSEKYQKAAENRMHVGDIIAHDRSATSGYLILEINAQEDRYSIVRVSITDPQGRKLLSNDWELDSKIPETISGSHMKQVYPHRIDYITGDTFAVLTRDFNVRHVYPGDVIASDPDESTGYLVQEYNQSSDSYQLLPALRFGDTWKSVSDTPENHSRIEVNKLYLYDVGYIPF